MMTRLLGILKAGRMSVEPRRDPLVYIFDRRTSVAPF